LIQPPNIKGHANSDGSVNQRTIDNYYTEASGGAAAICVMASYVRIDGRGFIGQLAMIVKKLSVALRIWPTPLKGVALLRAFSSSMLVLLRTRDAIITIHRFLLRLSPVSEILILKPMNLTMTRLKK